jgi:hypothetical protein
MSVLTSIAKSAFEVWEEMCLGFSKEYEEQRTLSHFRYATPVSETNQHNKMNPTRKAHFFMGSQII